MDKRKKDFVMTIDDIDVGDIDDDPEDEELEINKKEGFAFDFEDTEPVVSASPWNFASAKKKLLARNSIPTTSVDEKIQRRIQTRVKEEEVSELRKFCSILIIMQRQKKQAALQKEIDEAEVEYMGSVSLESASGSDLEDDDEENDDEENGDEEDDDEVMEDNENDDEDADSDDESGDIDQNEFVESDENNGDENGDNDANENADEEDDEGDEDEGDDENGAQEDEVEDMPKTDVLKDLPKRKGKAKKDTFFSERISGPEKEMTFDALQLSRPLLKAINELGYKAPTAVQQTTIPVALKGLDICGSAVTGSGKTAAFVLPILERLLWRDLRLPAVRVLILAPTRELAIQCHSVIENLAKYTNVRAALVTGGMAMKPQEVELRSFPDIIVATPGRMIDHLRNTMAFGIDSLDILVLDEADRLLEMGFFEEVEQIVKMCPKKRQTMLFSATMTEQVDKLIKLSLDKPVRVSVDPMFQMARKLTQEFIRIKGPREPERPAFLLALCTRTFKTKTIIFFQHKHTCHQMRIYFGLAGLRAAEIHGNLPQEKRLEALENFRDGKADFLLATDVAARGLDIVGIETVVNYTLPGNIQSYVHRVGRTARAGGTGRAVSLIGEKDRKMLKEVLKYQAANTKQRVLPPEAVAEWKDKLEKFQVDAQEIMKQENVEKELRTADMEATKVKNMIEHEDEIYSRPKKTWFISEKERKQLKEESVRQAKGEALNREDVRDSKKRKRAEMEEKKKKGDWETRKRQRTDELKEAEKLMKSAKRSTKPLAKKKKLKDMTDRDLISPSAKKRIERQEMKTKNGPKKKGGKAGAFGAEVKRAKFSEEKTFIPGKKRGKSSFKSKKRHKRR